MKNSIKTGLFIIGTYLSTTTLLNYVTSDPIDYFAIDPENTTSLDINYFNFSEMDSINIPFKYIEPVAGLEDIIVDHYGRFSDISDPERFSNAIFSSANKMGFDKESISTLDPKELIDLSYKIITERITYADVDSDPEFAKKHGEQFLPIDKYFYLGEGDCDKYAHLTIATFNLLKNINSDPKIENVYLSREFGNVAQPHAWVSITINESPDKLSLSQIDPTFYDSMGEIEACEFHVNRDHFEFRVLNELRHYTQSNEIIDKLISVDNDDDENRTLFMSKAFNYASLGNHINSAESFEKMVEFEKIDRLKNLWFTKASREYFKSGNDEDIFEIVQKIKDLNLPQGIYYSKILEIGIKSAERSDNKSLKMDYINELLTLYPESYSMEDFK